MLRHVLMLLLGTALTLASGTPALASQPVEPTDPLVVAENFLFARNTRDALGASALCSSLLAIQDAQGQWIADSSASREWFRQLTDTYTIDMLVHPHAEGDRVLWVERLAPRSVPFPEALQQSLDIQVEVVVQDGKIVSYSAAYPELAPRPTQPASQPPGGAAPLNQPVAPTDRAVFGSAVVLGGVILAAIIAILVRRRQGPPNARGQSASAY